MCYVGKMVFFFFYLSKTPLKYNCLHPTGWHLVLWKNSFLLASRQQNWTLHLTSRHCRNMNIKFTIYVVSNVSVPAIQPAFYTQVSESSLFCSCLCQSSCSLYVSARPEALCCSGPLHNVWLCSSRLFQATWRQSCRTRKVLNTTRARLTLLPLTVRWK